MSRIGKQPIKIEKGIEVKIDGSTVSVKGPKGNLSLAVKNHVEVSLKDDEITLALGPKSKPETNFLGLYRTLINNMVLGVSQGFSKQLELIGVGYRAAVQGNKLNLFMGFSHPTEFQIPENIEVKVENNTLLTISGINKQQIGQFAAEIRARRKPEPYKGKGARYKGEYVRKKAGKAGAKK